MKVRCINAKFSSGFLTENKVYDLVEDLGLGTFIRLNGYISGPWANTRFVVVEDTILPPGWSYCKCGTITSNPILCCECDQ
jgi:hypothetical protein